MIVVMMIRIVPRRTAFGVVLARASSKNWKPDQIGGRTMCQAMATAATVTIDPTSMVQPAIQGPAWLPTFFDHW